MRVLLDTNILFSALGFSGVPGRLLERLLTANETILTTDYILEELRQNIQEKFEPQHVQRALNLLSGIIASDKVQMITAESNSRNLSEAMELVNREDAPILAAAMLTEVTHFVTGDKDFLDNPRLP